MDTALWYTNYADVGEMFRLSWIGVPHYWRSTALPPNHCWANGDFVAFEDWPELEEAYNRGKFEGMLLAYNADSATQGANLGKWRPDAAAPTGLYTPNWGGRYIQAYTGSGSAGNTINEGLPGLTGAIGISHPSINSSSGVLSTSCTGGWRGGDYNAQQVTVRVNGTVDSPTYGNATSVVPPTIVMPVCIYLGASATDLEVV